MNCLSIIIVFLCSTLLLVTAQNDCPLPTNADIIAALSTLLNNADGSQTYNPEILGSVQHVCLSQGSRENTYRSASIIATFTPRTGQPQQTRIFQLTCESGPSWSADTSGGLATPDSSVVNGTTRYCRLCNHNFGNDRCQACASSCTSAGGLMRCIGLTSTCCTVFATNGQCATDCTSSGVNYVATVSTGFTCTCNLTCPLGYTVNSTCTGCDFTDICQRDTPCQNGGNCTLLSAPDDYTCDCTGTGYEGDNCTDLIPSPSPSPSPSPASSSIVPSPSCTLVGCVTCDTSTCCDTCQSGYTKPPRECTCEFSSSLLVVVPSCTVSGCSMCSATPPAAPHCCDTCSAGYDKMGACNCQLETSTPEMSSSTLPTASATPSSASGLPTGTLIGLILGILFGILLLLTLGAVIAYLIYYFVAGAGSATSKAKSKSPFANGESHNNPLYLAPDEVEGSNL